MFKTVWGKVIALASVGAAGLLVGGFVVSVFLPHSALAGNMMGSASGATMPSASTTRVLNGPSATSTDGQDALREQAARMLREHMGVSEQDATRAAATMADHMQQAHGEQAAALLKQCADSAGDMMNGGDTGSMMGSGSHESHHDGVGIGTAPGAASEDKVGFKAVL